LHTARRVMPQGPDKHHPTGRTDGTLLRSITAWGGLSNVTTPASAGYRYSDERTRSLQRFRSIHIPGTGGRWGVHAAYILFTTTTNCPRPSSPLARGRTTRSSAPQGLASPTPPVAVSGPPCPGPGAALDTILLRASSTHPSGSAKGSFVTRSTGKPACSVHERIIGSIWRPNASDQAHQRSVVSVFPYWCQLR